MDNVFLRPFRDVFSRRPYSAHTVPLFVVHAQPIQLGDVFSARRKMYGAAVEKDELVLP